MVLRVDAAGEFPHPREYSGQPSSQPPFGHGIHVAADEQTFFKIHRARSSKDFPPRPCEFPPASSSSFFFSHARVLGPHRCEGNPLSAIFVTGQGAKFFSSAMVRFGFSTGFMFHLGLSFCAKLL